MLHITNGDSAVSLLQTADLPGVIIPWRDALHEGPVPSGLSLEATSAVRAQFLAERGWGTLQQLRRSFQQRDHHLATSDTFEEIVLWFEHDLYDQLQLLQLLDWFAHASRSSPPLRLVHTNTYLTNHTPPEIRTLFEERSEVSSEVRALGQRAWDAFRSTDPTPWLDLLQEDTTSLPYLHGAILRHLQEYPDHQTGLSRTERQSLEAVLSGAHIPGDLFIRFQQMEERQFMGDTSLWPFIRRMSTSNPALLKTHADGAFTVPAPRDPFSSDFLRQELYLTDAGHQVLAGRLDWTQIQPPDRWLGGVHLNAENLWRWDAEHNNLLRTP